MSRGWLIAALLLGCGGGDDPDDPALAAPDQGPRAFCDEDWPVQSWATFGQGFLTSYCAGCHSEASVDRAGAPAGVDFDTAAQALEWAPRILARATGEAPDMPPAGGPPAETLLRLRIWLECFEAR